MEIKNARSKLTYQAVRFTVADYDAIQAWITKHHPQYRLSGSKLYYWCGQDQHLISCVEHSDYIVVSEAGVSVYSDVQYRHLYEEIGTLSST